MHLCLRSQGRHAEPNPRLATHGFSLYHVITSTGQNHDCVYLQEASFSHWQCCSADRSPCPCICLCSVLGVAYFQTCQAAQKKKEERNKSSHHARLRSASATVALRTCAEQRKTQAAAPAQRHNHASSVAGLAEHHVGRLRLARWNSEQTDVACQWSMAIVATQE